MISQAAVSAEAQLRDIHWSFARSMALLAAVDLDVINKVAKGNDTLRALCEATSASPRGMRPLLDALVGLGLLQAEGERLKPSPVSEAFLVDDCADDHRPYVLLLRGLMENWLHLTECVRRGTPFRAASVDQKAKDVFPALASALFGANRPAAREVAEILHARRPGARVLDVAAGSGVWGIALAQADEEAAITAHDLDDVLPVARRHIEAHGLAERFSYLPGRLSDVDLGQAAYDIVILGHICHSEGLDAAADLIVRGARALRPGGLLVIADMIPSDERDGPLFALLFGLNMLVHTTHGDVFTAGQYREWLGRAGLGDIEFLETSGGTQVILAAK